ncbi:MAG: hypothetical protein K0B15_06130 [Lentimicrobium sp.]|nr:hypothetical protein [Lentimicrobium sp.]
MRKIMFFLVSLCFIVMASCDFGGENYVRYYDYVNIDSTRVQDSAMVGDTVHIYALAGAPNGCWSDLVIYFYPYNDSVYLINSIGLYESYEGICPEVYVTKDSTFQFIPDATGTFIFVSESRSNYPKYDTLRIVDPQ